MKCSKIKNFFLHYKHGLIPLIYLPFYMAVFYYIENRPLEKIHIIEMSIDKYIPFCEIFIIPYYLWFIYIAAGVTVFVFLDRSDYYKLCLTLGVGMTLFLFISYVYPNGLDLRPQQFPRDNFLTDLVKGLHLVDTSTNVFPSIHCFNSLAVNAAICHNKILSSKPVVRISSQVLCILIILSTVFLKQHSCFDVIAAFLLFMAMYIPLYILPATRSSEAGKSEGVMAK